MLNNLKKTEKIKRDFKICLEVRCKKQKKTNKQCTVVQTIFNKKTKSFVAKYDPNFFL